MLTGWLLVVLLATDDRYQIVGLYSTEKQCQRAIEKLKVHVYRDEQRSMKCVTVEESRKWK